MLRPAACRAATTPFLELQVSLERTDVKENEHILEVRWGGA